MANWISRDVPDLAPMPAGLRAAQQAEPVYGDDVIRYRTEDAASYNGIELWTTEVAFKVGRRFTVIEYLYTDGQAVHDGGRRGRAGTLSVEFFGSGWGERAQALLYEIEHASEVGRLTLPYPWGTLDARLWSGEPRHDPTTGGCSMTLEWREESPASEVDFDDRPPTTGEVMAAIPSDAEDVSEAAQSYLLGLTDTGMTVDDLLLLILEMRTMATIYAQGVEEQPVTPSILLGLDGIALALAGAIRLFPSPSALSAVW